MPGLRGPPRRTLSLLNLEPRLSIQILSSAYQKIFPEISLFPTPLIFHFTPGITKSAWNKEYWHEKNVSQPISMQVFFFFEV